MAQKEKGLRPLINRVGLIIITLSLFIAGIHILRLEIPFWSMFLGLASIQIGLVFSIFTFEQLFRSSSKPVTEDYKTIPCLICKKPSFVPKHRKTTICDDCQVKIASRAKSFMILVLALFSVVSISYLVNFDQDIRRQAEEKYSCEEGVWNPETCSCGEFKNIDCQPTSMGRECSDQKDYCCSLEIKEGVYNWDCTLIDSQ